MPLDERQSPRRQVSLTVVARVEDDERLRAALGSLGPNAFAAPELGIHFARLVVLPEDTAPPGSRNGPNTEGAAWLVLESNFDTALADDDPARGAHLDVLASRTLSTVGRAFAACEGLAPGASAGDVAAYWKARIVPATASYQGHANRDVRRIKLEQRLREVVLAFFEKADRASPPELFDRVRRHVRACAKTDPLLAGLDIDAPAPALPDPEVRSKFLRESWSPWIRDPKLTDTLPIVGQLPRVVLDWERHDLVYDVRAHQEQWTDADRAAFGAIAATEDYGTQNALTHVVPLRGGSGRLALLEHAHAVVDTMSQQFFQYIGQLGTIPSIHFAKWLLIEEGRRLVFLSNYDKSWESYLGDFVDKAPTGLNLAWSCTQEYPRTVALAFDGAKDEETFKAWGRAYQVPTQVFYSAYADLTIETINNNTLIRHRLHQPADAGGLDAWFRRVT
jgi:hypothetical protein